MIFTPLVEQNGEINGEYAGRLSMIEPCSTLNNDVPRFTLSVPLVSAVLLITLNRTVIVLYTL